VRPHAPSVSPLTFLLDPSGHAERFDYPTWPTASDPHPPSIFGDVAFVEGRPIAVGMVQGLGPSTVILAHREPHDRPSAGAQPPTKAAHVEPVARWGFTITALAPSAMDDGPLVTSTDWTYSGTSIGLTSFVADTKRERGWALFHAFRSDGTFAPARPVP